MKTLSHLLVSNVFVRLLSASVLLGFTTGCGHFGVDLEGNKDKLGTAGDKDASVHGEGGAPSVPVVPIVPGIKPPVKPVPSADASVDPTPVPTVKDSGVAPSVDSGMGIDSGMSEVDSGADGGKEDPALVCEPNQKACTLECVGTNTCDVTCGEGSECTAYAGESSEVVLECEAGASCRAKKNDGVKVNFVCDTSGHCEGHCGSTRECNMECTGTGNCDLYCGTSSTCVLACVDGAKCTLHRSEQNIVSRIDGCLTGAVECQADGTRRCNLDCPTKLPL